MPAPARGRRAASRASPFEQVDVLEIQRLAVAVNGEDAREADGGLGGRDRHHEVHEYLAGAAEPLRQLDAHEDHDRVPTEQHAGDAQREQHGRDEEGGSEQHHSLRLARTTAPTMAASSRTLVISNGTRYASNSGRATLPTIPCSAAARAIASGGSRIAAGGPATRSTPSWKPSTPASATPTARPSGPLMSVAAWRPRLSSMMTNRNSTMMAPAYTSTWSTAMNWASSTTNSAASENSVTTSHRALATALRRVMQKTALPIARPANAQKMITLPLTAYSPFGSEGSHSVETGCVCAHRRSRSYTNRSRENSEFS